MKAQRLDFARGDWVYITAVALPTLDQVRERCQPVQVEYVTDKAVLVAHDERQQWIPLAALTTSSRHDVFALARWFDVEADWRPVFGAVHPHSGKNRNRAQQNQALATHQQGKTSAPSS